MNQTEMRTNINTELLTLKNLFKQGKFVEALANCNHLLDEEQLKRLNDLPVLKEIVELTLLRIKIAASIELNLPRNKTSAGFSSEEIKEAAKNPGRELKSLDGLVRKYEKAMNVLVKYDGVFKKKLYPSDVFNLQIELALAGPIYKKLDRNIGVDFSRFHDFAKQGIENILNSAAARTPAYKEIEIEDMIKFYQASFSERYLINPLKIQANKLEKMGSKSKLVKYERLFLVVKTIVDNKTTRNINERQLATVCYQTSQNRNSPLLPLYLIRITLLQNKQNQQQNSELLLLTSRFYQYCRRLPQKNKGLLANARDLIATNRQDSLFEDKTDLTKLILQNMFNILNDKFNKDKPLLMRNKYETAMDALYDLLLKKTGKSGIEFQLLERLDERFSTKKGKNSALANELSDKYVKTIIKLCSGLDITKNPIHATMLEFVFSFLKNEVQLIIKNEMPPQYIQNSKFGMFSGSRSSMVDDSPVQDETFSQDSHNVALPSF